MFVPNFLFSLSLVFNFKIRSSLGLSCLMSSMFIIIIITFIIIIIIIVIIIIIFIIKTTCFDNTILIAELEGKVL